MITYDLPLHIINYFFYSKIGITIIKDIPFFLRDASYHKGFKRKGTGACEWSRSEEIG